MCVICENHRACYLDNFEAKTKKCPRCLCEQIAGPIVRICVLNDYLLYVHWVISSHVFCAGVGISFGVRVGVG